MIDHFSEAYVKQCPEVLGEHAISAFYLAYAAVMLNTQLYNPEAKKAATTGMADLAFFRKQVGVRLGGKGFCWRLCGKGLQDGVHSFRSPLPPLAGFKPHCRLLQLPAYSFRQLPVCYFFQHTFSKCSAIQWWGGALRWRGTSQG